MMMRVALTLVAATTVVLTACDSPSSIADDITFEIPAGFIGKGAIVTIALVNENDTDVHAGSLPCVVRLEQLIEAKWEVVSGQGPCPDNIVIVPGEGRVGFNYPMPDEIGTYRLAVTLTHSVGGGTFVTRTRRFQTVGIAID